MSTLPTNARRKAPVRREFGRIPPKMRDRSVRLASGRGWKGLEANDDQVAAALGIDRRNAARRRSGESGPFAGTCVEAYRLSAAKISVYPLIVQMRVIERQARIKDVPTSVLDGWLKFLQSRETEADARLDEKQMRYVLDSESVCLREFADRGRQQMRQLEEIVAICEELIAREEGRA